MKIILQSIRALLVLTVLTGAAYPLFVTVAARLIFPKTSAGSLVERNGRVIGSSLLAQKVSDPRYFWPRPSAADYATIPSSASNLGPTSAALKKAIAERRDQLGKDAPEELLTTSASGLDPHLSPEAAKYQARRVASARHLALDEVTMLIDSLTESPQLGFLGQPRVNVLALNLALDDTQ